MAQDYNLWAIILAVVANQAIGAAWYSPPLFAKVWMKEVGHTPESIREGPRRQPFVVALVTAVVLAVALAWAHAAAGATGPLGGAVVGLIVGVGLVAMAVAPHYAFSGRSLRLYLIDQGHSVVAIVVMSVIIGAWR